jgi:hypothetical protein
MPHSFGKGAESTGPIEDGGQIELAWREEGGPFRIALARVGKPFGRARKVEALPETRSDKVEKQTLLILDGRLYERGNYVVEPREKTYLRCCVACIATHDLARL